MFTTTTDVLEYRYATGNDKLAMEQGSHYDYVKQGWVDGHDHAHFDDDKGPLAFCGCDYVTCCDPMTVTEPYDCPPDCYDCAEDNNY